MIVPNPGSNTAIQQGCVCPQMDNHYGAGVPYIDGPVYWINPECKMHAGPHVEWEEDDDEAQ